MTRDLLCPGGGGGCGAPRAGSTSVLEPVVSPGPVSPQEENIQREKQLLLDAQRQAALEKEVCVPAPSLSFVPPAICPPVLSRALGFQDYVGQYHATQWT